jgi:hypothetical protein
MDSGTLEVADACSPIPYKARSIDRSATTVARAAATLKPLPSEGVVKAVLPVLAVLALAGCARYPTAEKVADCAANRFGTKNGAFTIARRSRSILYGAEYAIAYQKSGSTDRGVVIYNRVQGAISSHQEISYGNHAEIKGAVEAIENCVSFAADQ